MADETKILSLAVGTFILTVIILGVVVYSAVPLTQTTKSTQQKFLVVTGGEKEKTLTVYGVGTVKASPDQLKIVLAVVTEAKTARQAASENAEKMDMVVKALKSLGISESNLKTSGYQITPIYSYKTKNTPKIVGYRVTDTLTVTTKNLKSAGKIIDMAVEAGVNKISSVHFGFSDETLAKLKEEALIKAVNNAALKAETIAKSLNIKIVGVKRVTLTGFQPILPRPISMYEAAAEAKTITPVFPGEGKVTVRVNVVYLIE